MASLIYDSFWVDLENGAVNPSSDTFKVMLTTSTYTESKTTHSKRSDVTNEVTGTGYTAGGASTTATVSYDSANNRVNLSIGAASWTGSTITARKAVVYKSRGGLASADNLVCVIDFGSDVSTTSGTFTLTASTVRIQN